MLSAVIPVKNEQHNILKVIQGISQLPIDLVIPVINGSTDKSLKKLLLNSILPTKIIFSTDALGIDIPRAVGAKLAFDMGSDIVMFVDGDMKGNIGDSLAKLITTTYEQKLDMALTDCYAGSAAKSCLAELILYFRTKLNEKIQLYDNIENCSPSHGPHMVSRKLLETIGFKPLAIPPVSLALAARNSLAIGSGATIPHLQLGSTTKSEFHTNMIAKTIIGDTIQAMNEYDGKNPSRVFGGKEYIGYHAQRNWQALNSFLKDTNFLKHL